MNHLEVKDLQFNYGNNLVLKDVSFEIKKGSFTSIIGPNGSGKSTLLKNLINLYDFQFGNILIEGKDIKQIKKKDLAKKISLVPQDTSINYDFTVEDIVMMGRYPYKRRFEGENDYDYKIVKQSLLMTNTLDLKDRPITQISSGERQRVVIAKALAQQSSIIILDEPTSNLDINHQIEILHLLKSLNQNQGTTVILVIHDINLAGRYSDEIILLHNGQILDMGKPEKVITKTNIKKTYNIDVAIEKNKYTNSVYLTPLNLPS